MKNKTLFKVFGLLRKLGIKPSDINIDTKDEESMAALAIKIFGALLNMHTLENEYYEIVCEVWECSKEEAEEKEVMETLQQFVISLKGNVAFSGGAL